MANSINRALVEEFTKLFNDLENIHKEANNPTSFFIRTKSGNVHIFPRNFNPDTLTIDGELVDEYRRDSKLFINSESVKVNLRELDPETTKVVIREQGYTDTTKTRKLPKTIRSILSISGDSMKKEKINTNHLDEEGKTLTIEAWKEAEEVADTPRKRYERRAVVVDGDELYINASAAIEHMPLFRWYREGKGSDRDPRKDADIFYKKCETDHNFLGVFVAYATKEDISKVIEEMESKVD